MKLWAIEKHQDRQIFAKNGVLRHTTASWGFKPEGASQWIKDQMTHRIGPPSSNELFPVYTVKRWNGKNRVDLRTFRWHYPKGWNMVRIECECPDDKVLLCDYELWFYVLNHWYLPESLADLEEFEAKFPWQPRTARIKYPDAEFQTRIRRSWDRILDLFWHDSEFTHPPETRPLIGWVWEIKREWVVSETPFAGCSTISGPKRSDYSRE
jgi:hypothetical protein